MSVRETIHPQLHTLGALPIRRILPAPQRQMVGPFIFMDQGGPVTVPNNAGGGVPEHPHAGLSTFTYLMDGVLKHRDSAGYAATIRAGDIALMTAGRGITHEEMPDRTIKTPTQAVFFAQLWLALPDALEALEPTFAHHRQDDVPVVRDAGVAARVAGGVRAWAVGAGWAGGAV